MSGIKTPAAKTEPKTQNAHRAAPVMKDPASQHKTIMPFANSIKAPAHHNCTLYVSATWLILFALSLLAWRLGWEQLRAKRGSLVLYETPETKKRSTSMSGEVSN